MTQMIVESKKRKLEWESLHIYIYIIFISSWEKYEGFAKKAKLSLKKGKKTYMWRWCRSSVRNQSVASLIRNAIGISSVRAMPDPHQPGVQSKSSSSSVSNFHRWFTFAFNSPQFFFFIYLVRSINKKPSRSKR